jgi:hypothetical protein
VTVRSLPRRPVRQRSPVDRLRVRPQFRPDRYRPRPATQAPGAGSRRHAPDRSSEPSTKRRRRTPDWDSEQRRHQRQSATTASPERVRKQNERDRGFNRDLLRGGGILRMHAQSLNSRCCAIAVTSSSDWCGSSNPSRALVNRRPSTGALLSQCLLRAAHLALEKGEPLIACRSNLTFWWAAS